MLKVLLSIVVFSIFAFPVFAQIPNPDPVERAQERREEKIQEREEKREGVVEKRCEVIEERVSERIAKYSANKDIHVENYNKLIEKLEEIVEKLNERGLDTATLVANIETFEAMAVDYSHIYDHFIEELGATGDLACGESDGAFKDLLMQARNSLLEAKEKRLELRRFYIENIRKEISNLRSQIVLEGEQNEAE